MRALIFVVLTSVAATAPTCLAQSTLVIPPWAASEEGNSLDQQPFGDDTSHHLQFVDGSYLVAMPQGSMITAISYRGDKQYAQQTATSTLRRTGSPIWYLRLANTSTSAFAPTGNWPDRPDQGPPDPLWPFAILARPISFPDLSVPPQGVPNFELRLPLDQPVMWTGPHLGVDHYVYDTNGSQHRYFVDAVQQSSPGGTVGPIGAISPSCPLGYNRASGVAPDPGGLLEMLLFDAQPRSPAIAMLGVAPAMLDLSPAGMRGCFLFLQPQVQIPLATNNVGLASFRTNVPATATLAGASFFGQWLVSDPRITPTPIASSDGLAFTLGSSITGRQVALATVTNAASPTAASGFVTKGRGLVMEIEWQ